MRRFANGENVRFVRTSDSRLDGMTGIVLGRFGGPNSLSFTDYYIVKMDVDIVGYDPAIVLTEHCLEKI